MSGSRPPPSPSGNRSTPQDNTPVSAGTDEATNHQESVDRNGGSAEGGATVPPLTLQSPQVTELLRVCGENVGLIADHRTMFKFDSDAPRKILHLQLFEQQFAGILLSQRPLERALKDTVDVKCCCFPLSCLEMKNGILAGSQAEGLYTELKPPFFQSTSDADIMVEFGPVEWVFQTASWKTASDGVGAAETQGGIAAPRLTIKETDNPGFVLLLQEPSSDCQHQQPLLFQAQYIKKFYDAFQRIVFKGTWKLHKEEGPACSYSQTTDKPFTISEMDHVPCLHVPVWWISDEFFTRRRRYSWPPKSARDDIRRYGLHLVAKGAPGSITERFEWRISFSRAELIISLYLTLVQKGAVILFKKFKSIKALLGEKSKALKSYYVKTALLWLCEETQPESWTSAQRGVLMLVDYLDVAVRERKLSCYFLSSINLFCFVSRDDLKAMEITLETIRENWMLLLAYDACTAVPDLAAKLTQHTRQLSENELRVYSMRNVITKCLAGNLLTYIKFIEADLSKLLPMLLRSYPSDGDMFSLRSLLPRYGVQSMLYKALTMAPVDLAAEVFQSLSGSSRDGFVWDAAPLLGLLTEEDLKALLWDPDAVRAWLRQQRRLPAEERLSGLPAELKSPRDLCDLLLNIPLLVQVLMECVPDKFDDLKKKTSYVSPLPRISMIPVQEMREITLEGASQWKNLAVLFQHVLGVDQTKAWRIACRYGVEMRQLCDAPETLAAHKRIGHTLPDTWQMQHLVWNDARFGGITFV